MSIILDMEKIQCSSCNIEFAAPNPWAVNRQKDGKTFYCPNGCKQYFTPHDPKDDEIEELKRQVGAKERQVDTIRGMYHGQKNTNRTLRGVVTKLKKVNS